MSSRFLCYEPSIRILCYELYKLEWMRRISVERQKDAMKNWYQETDESERSYYKFEDFVNDNGYDGELYVCFSEFLGAEYRDKEYIRALLDNEHLYQEYLDDTEAQESSYF